VDIINLLKQKDKHVYAMLAPAWEGQFGSHVSVGSMAAAIRELGFTEMYEVALGADYTASTEAEEWSDAYNEGKKMTTSCCPAFVKMIRKHFPGLTDNISTTLSPMAATAKLIKAMDPEAICVFIGPCIAKKEEVLDSISLNAADYALTLDELVAMFRAKEIEPKSFSGNVQQGSIYGKKFCISGGVTASVVQSLKESNGNTGISVKVCNGATECKKALMLMKVGKLPEDFMEGMACEGGCSNGPGSILTGRAANVNREKLFAQADSREIHENLKEYENYEFSMHRH
jgi:ferredoxin hydrogenase large subunit